LKEHLGSQTSESVDLKSLGLTHLPALSAPFRDYETVDLSGNAIKSLKNLSSLFPTVRHLILDDNAVHEDLEEVGSLPLLETLSLRNNGILPIP
jgi:hypothetical protein